MDLQRKGRFPTVQRRIVARPHANATRDDQPGVFIVGKPRNRVVRAITDAMWKRDQLQMRVAEALLSAVEPPRRRRDAARRMRAAKARR